MRKIILRKRENPLAGGSYFVAYFRYDDGEELPVGRSGQDADALKAELERVYDVKVEIEGGDSTWA